MPFPDQSFDFVVSIGCMHHTGNVQCCFDETFRVLKPGGVAVLMVYNRFSWMRWRQVPWATFLALVRGQQAGLTSDGERAHYDSNTAGQAAPETALFSLGELKGMLRAFAQVTGTSRNANPFVVKGVTLLPRCWLLPTLGRWLGLDLYVEARKAANSTQIAVAA